MLPETEIEALIAANPDADAEKVRESLRTIRELREKGITKQTGYSIASPFARRPASSSNVESLHVRKHGPGRR